MSSPDIKIDDLFNRAAEAAKTPETDTNPYARKIAKAIVDAYNTGDFETFRDIKSKSCIRLPVALNVEVMYFVEKMWDPEKIDLLRKEFESSMVGQKINLISTAVKYQDMGFLQNHRDKVQKNLTVYYCKDINTDWLEHNLDALMDIFQIDLTDAAFKQSLEKLIESDQLDALKIFDEKINDPSYGKIYLLNALKHKHQAAIDYFVTDRVFEAFAKAEQVERHRRTKVMLEHAFNISPDLTLNLMQNMHQHNIFDGFAPPLDFEKLVKSNAVPLVQSYLDLGYTIPVLSLQNHIGQAACAGREEILSLFLNQPGDHFNTGFNHRYTRGCITNKHLSCLKMLHDHGYGKDSATNPTMKEHVHAVMDKETLDYLLSKEYPLPADRRVMLHDSKPWGLKYHVKRLYHYIDLQAKKLDIPSEDLAVLSKMPLSNLRKRTTFPSGTKARGITYAALGDKFDIVLKAAVAHTQPAPFSRMDLYHTDEHFKCRAMDILVAFDQADKIFTPILWKNREPDVHEIFKHCIPDAYKERYKRAYQDCLTALKIDAIKPAAPMTLRRRKPKP